MEKEIKELKEKVKQLEEEYSRQKKTEYESKEHKLFNKGDFVTNGTDIGVVAWVENNACGITEKDGYFGLDIKTGNLGFRAPCKRDDFWLIPCRAYRYYTETHSINLLMTGEDIDRLMFRLRHNNDNGHVKAVLHNFRTDKIGSLFTKEQITPSLL